MSWSCNISTFSSSCGVLWPSRNKLGLLLFFKAPSDLRSRHCLSHAESLILNLTWRPNAPHCPLQVTVGQCSRLWRQQQDWIHWRDVFWQTKTKLNVFSEMSGQFHGNKGGIFWTRRWDVSNLYTGEKLWYLYEVLGHLQPSQCHQNWCPDVSSCVFMVLFLMKR